MLLALRLRAHAVARRRGSKTEEIRAGPKAIAQGSRSRTWPRAFTSATPHSLPSDFLVARVGAFDNANFCWYKIQHGRRTAVQKTPGVVRDSIRRNGDLAGAKTRAR